MNRIDTRSVTFNLIAINVVVYIAANVFPALYEYLSLHYIFNTHHFIPHSEFLPVQVISHMFMHAPIGGSIGIMHIAFNMFALYMFGTILEKVWGAKRFLLFYFITGLGAVLLHMAVMCFLVFQSTGTVNPSFEMLQIHPDILQTYFSTTVGASGAIFGVLTAFAVLFPNTDLYFLFIPIPIKAKFAISFYILLELYLGISMQGGDNVAHFAHLGGALFGFLLVKYWNKNRRHFY